VLRLVTLAALLMALTVSATADAYPRPPKMPGTTRGAKRCGTVKRYGYTFRVFVVKNHRVSCRTARTVARRGVNARGWTSFDWTKGGNGPWSDVWLRHDRHAVVAIINA